MSGAEAFLKREQRIRQKVLSVFNKTEADFESKADFNNYLELSEDIAFNLIEGIDAAETTLRLAQYERENADSIVSADVRQAETVRQAQATIRDEAGKTTSSVTAEAAAAASARAEGHGSLQYAAAQPIILEQRQAPTLVAESSSENSVFPQRDDKLDDFQLHARMAKASGWDPGIVNARAMQQAFMSLC